MSFLRLSCFCQHAVRRVLQYLSRNPRRKLDEARYEDRGTDWYVYLHRARRCQFSLQPTDGPRKPHCEDTFGMILRTQPNLPHQRRSLQMGGGHPVPIGRGLRGNKSLHKTVTDVFSNWPLDTAECEGSDKLQLKLFVGIALFAAEATCTKGWLRLHMRIRPRNFSVARSCCHDP